MVVWTSLTPSYMWYNFRRRIWFLFFNHSKLKNRYGCSDTTYCRNLCATVINKPASLIQNLSLNNVACKDENFAKQITYLLILVCAFISVTSVCLMHGKKSTTMHEKCCIWSVAYCLMWCGHFATNCFAYTIHYWISFHRKIFRHSDGHIIKRNCCLWK